MQLANSVFIVSLRRRHRRIMFIEPTESCSIMIEIGE